MTKTILIIIALGLVVLSINAVFYDVIVLAEKGRLDEIINMNK